MVKSLVCLVLTLGVISSVQAQSQRSPKNMSTREIQDERYGIQQMQKQVGYMKQVGGKIRDGACRSYWRAAKRALDEMKQVPEYYAEKRNRFAEENRAQLAKYRKCFSSQLPNYPAIYNNDLDPARSYEQFIQTYDRLTAEYNNGMQARFYDLGRELKRRGAG